MHYLLGAISLSLLITLTIRTSDNHVTTLCDDKVTRKRKKLGTTSRQQNTKRERERQRNALHIQLLSCDLRSLSLENQYIAKVDLSLLLYELILISRIAYYNDIANLIIKERVNNKKLPTTYRE